MRTKFVAAAVSIAGLVLAVACGGGNGAGGSSPTPGTPPVASGGSVAPNVFMDFQGRRYQAVDVGSGLVTGEQVEVAGTTEEIDIDHSGPVEVYRLRDGSSDALYTFAPGVAVAGEEGTTPDVWLRWEPAARGDSGAVPPTSGGQAVPPDDTVSATPVPDMIVEVDRDAMVATAREHLAQRLGVSVDSVEVVSVERDYLPHPSCLNLGPDQACIEVAAEGYRVVMAADGARYEYFAYSDTEVYPAP